MRLGARLEAVARFVPDGAAVADIGCDHAMLCAALVRRGLVQRAIGIDRAAGALRSARERLGDAELGIELRRGHGFDPLEPGEVNAVVLAGMGGARMVRLVEEADLGGLGIETLVLQPNRDWDAVRRFIAARGLPLRDEVMVRERGHDYVVLAVGTQVAKRPSWDETDLLLGPMLRRRGDAALRRHVRDRMTRWTRVLETVHGRGKRSPQLERRLAVYAAAAAQLLR